MDINVEKVFSLQPDIVVTAPLTDPKAQEKLKNLSVRSLKTVPRLSTFTKKQKRQDAGLTP